MTRTLSRCSKPPAEDETDSPERPPPPPPRPVPMRQPSPNVTQNTLLQPLVMQFSIVLQVLFLVI